MSDKEIIAQQAEQIAQLESSLQAAMQEIAELKALLAKHSGNSSLPPSSDGLKAGGRPKKPAFPRSVGKPRGGTRKVTGAIRSRWLRKLMQ